jgi:O-methyltransferase
VDRFDYLIRVLTRIDGLAGQAQEQRRLGLDWPQDGAETMVGVERLLNVKRLAADVLARGVPGDFMECGTWKGGVGILMAAMLEDYMRSTVGQYNRTLYIADSFEGCPAPDPAYPADAGDPHSSFEFLRVPLEQVQQNFRRYRLLRQFVEFLPGWFRYTLPGPVRRLALLRIDADLYQSTTEALEALYDLVSPGGYVILDDFHNIPNCRAAIQDFRARRGITTPMEAADSWCAVYWKKEAAEPAPTDAREAVLA